MKILFTGGGTGGSVTPLIAIYQQLIIKSSSIPFEFFWIGGKEGLEKEMVSQYNSIKYYGISSGKFRRYFSWQNFIDPFRVIKAFFQSLKILHKIKPQAIVTAGSYISVPVIRAAAFLKIPILVHQQDLQPGLANKLMARHAKKITVSFQESLKDFFKEKTVYTGNPVREEVLAPPSPPLSGGGSMDNLPTLLIIGGGTGALPINRAVIKRLSRLVEIANIFHITGKDKKIDIPNNIKNIHRYHQFNFLGKELFNIIKIADLVVTRSGMSTLSELAILGKPTIIIPIPHTHQEKNAYLFYKNNAAIIYEQKNLEDDGFIELIAGLLNNQAQLDNLSLNIRKMMPSDAAERVAGIVLEIAS